MRLLASLALGLSLLTAAGCGTMGSRGRLEASATVPLPEELPSAGRQRRTLPWTERSESVAAAATLKLPLGPSEPGTESPGLVAGREWLAARSRAQRALETRLEALPASEPPPGESRLLSLADFAARRPELLDIMRTQVADAAETRTLSTDGTGRLGLSLPLRPLAEAVLLQGGGFTPESSLGKAMLPAERARRDAETQARRALTQKLLESEVGPGFRYYEWVMLSTDRRAAMEAAIGQARVVRSEEQPGPDGRPQWVAEMDLELKPLRQRALEDYRDWKKLRTRDAAR